MEEVAKAQKERHPSPHPELVFFPTCHILTKLIPKGTSSLHSPLEVLFICPDKTFSVLCPVNNQADHTRYMRF